MTVLAQFLPILGPSGLLVIALLGLFALAMSFVARRWLPISEVVAFLVIGVVVGPRVLGVIDRHAIHTLEPLTAVALGAMVFLIGERLRIHDLRRMRRTLLPISLVGSAVAFVACFFALLAAGISVPTAYLLAAIAPSTAPVTVQAIVSERRATGPFTDHVLAATALNTLVAGLLFGFGAPFVFAEVGHGSASRVALRSFVQLVIVAVAAGVAGGAALRVARKHVERWGDRILLVWVTLLLVVGTVVALNSSVVIATLVFGAVVANSRTRATELFDAVRVLEAPIFLVFFIVTGADVHMHEFITLGVAGTAYVAARALGRTAGSWLGVLVSPARRWGWSYWVGTAQLPYAGMAVGLASYTVGRAASVGAPGVGTDVATLVLGTVFLFELFTPPLLERALGRVGEAHSAVGAATATIPLR